MLNIRLSAVEEAPRDVLGEIPASSDLFAGTEFNFSEPVSVEGRISSAGHGSFFLRARVVSEMKTECRRCLEPVAEKVNAEINVILAGSNPEDDPSVYVLDEDTDLVDLSPIVREELILSVPGDVLCRDDCRGLCAGCGVNLNNEECRCSKAADPRWAALEQLNKANQSER